MTFRNLPGSVSALSLASSPTAPIAVAAMTGVAITASAAVFIYRKFEHYKARKHKEAIEVVNALHKKYLETIIVFDRHDIQGFPPIFKIETSDDTLIVDSMHLTDEEIMHIGNRLPYSIDVVLSTYVEAICNAIQKLKAFYFCRKKKHDITAGVLAYLLHILGTKCLHFEGYDYDIAYLNAINHFIIAYASLHEREETQDFSRLNTVFSYLCTAKQILEKHKEKLSLEENVSELRGGCVQLSNQFIRCFTQLFVAEKKWDAIKFTSMKELKEGVLSGEYIRTEIKGWILSKHKKIEIDDSIFRAWLIELADYYLETIDCDTKLKNEDVILPDKLFTLIDWERYEILISRKQQLTQPEFEELSIMRRTLQSLVEFFKTHPHFLTTKLDPSTVHKIPKMMPISDPTEIKDRVLIMSDLGYVIHKIISLQYFCTHLLKSIKQLGELYVKNPHHFCGIFSTLNALCHEIKESIGKCKVDLTRARQSDMNTMHLQAQEMLPTEIQSLLATAYATISKLGTNIKDYRNRVAKNLNLDEPTHETVKWEMFEVADLLTGMYGLRVPLDMDHADESTTQALNITPISRKPTGTFFQQPDVEEDGLTPRFFKTQP